MTEAALAFFNSLPPLEVATMIGSWQGKGVETGHPIDGLLEWFGWHGKRFTGSDGAHPLVFERPKGGLFSVNPAMIPMGLVVRHADLFRHPWYASFFEHLASCFEPTSRRRGCA